VASNRGEDQLDDRSPRQRQLKHLGRTARRRRRPAAGHAQAFQPPRRAKRGAGVGVGRNEHEATVGRSLCGSRGRPLGGTQTSERSARETPSLARSNWPAVESAALIARKMMLQDLELRRAQNGPRELPVDAVHRLDQRVKGDDRLAGPNRALERGVVACIGVRQAHGDVRKDPDIRSRQAHAFTRNRHRVFVIVSSRES
jgi:hypothetical protein